MADADEDALDAALQKDMEDLKAFIAASQNVPLELAAAAAAAAVGPVTTAVAPVPAAPPAAVFVRNVHFDATESDLRDHFRACGDIAAVHIVVNPYTHAPRGFAYIELADATCVPLALALSGTTLLGRALDVRRKWASGPRAAPVTYRGGGFRGRGRGRGRSSFGSVY